MANEYVTATQLKVPLKIVNANDDAWLAIVATGASRAVDRYCGRRFYVDSTTSERYYHAVGANLVVVDDFSTTTGLVVKTDDNDDGTAETTWAATDYEVSPRNGLRNGLPWAYTGLVAVEGRYFPTGSRAMVAVTAKWGWPAVPDEVTQACYILGAELFKRKDAPFGVADFGEFGAVRIREDARLRALLQPFRREDVTRGIA